MMPRPTKPTVRTAIATLLRIGPTPSPSERRGRSWVLLLVGQVRRREHHEHVQVLGDLHEPVLLAVIDRDDLAWLDLGLLVDDPQSASALKDDVDLVGHVRGLLVLGADG